VVQLLLQVVLLLQLVEVVELIVELANVIRIYWLIAVQITLHMRAAEAAIPIQVVGAVQVIKLSVINPKVFFTKGNI